MTSRTRRTMTRHNMAGGYQNRRRGVKRGLPPAFRSAAFPQQPLMLLLLKPYGETEELYLLLRRQQVSRHLQALPPQARHGVLHRIDPSYRLSQRAVIGRAASRRRSPFRAAPTAVALPSPHLLAQPLGLLAQGLHGFLPLAPQVSRFLVQLRQPLGKPGTGGLVQLQGLQQFLPPLGFEVPDAFLHVLAAALRRRHAVKLFHRRWRWR